MAKPASFEQSLKDLEEAVSRLEQGQLPLHEALSCFETGVKSAGRCRELLGAVTARVEVLLKDASGNLRSEAFAGDDPADDEE